jgi:hypothetical protein
MEGDLDCCPLDHGRAERLLEILRKSLLPRNKRVPLGAANIKKNKAAVRKLDLIPNCLTCRPLLELRAKMLPEGTDGDAPTEVQMQAVADVHSMCHEYWTRHLEHTSIWAQSTSPLP